MGKKRSLYNCDQNNEPGIDLVMWATPHSLFFEPTSCPSLRRVNGGRERSQWTDAAGSTVIKQPHSNYRLEQQEGEKNETAFFLQDTNAVFTMTAVDSLGFESRAPEETQDAYLEVGASGVGKGNIQFKVSQISSGKIRAGEGLFLSSGLINEEPGCSVTRDLVFKRCW
ncbi:hypothetical protein E5288_WYG006497 [Bos mutus]|uniref:Uncharacterized protein n=1 Tax=Bos mutus TaxID=72004 RepID=A0A6B0RAC9_9CETA|nr:hypothetical protein [Bos mutus]